MSKEPKSGEIWYLEMKHSPTYYALILGSSPAQENALLIDVWNIQLNQRKSFYYHYKSGVGRGWKRLI